MQSKEDVFSSGSLVREEKQWQTLGGKNLLPDCRWLPGGQIKCSFKSHNLFSLLCKFSVLIYFYLVVHALMQLVISLLLSS